ncbi:hypothetical protein COOONC_08539, partial [Cooperia oncophora]
MLSRPGPIRACAQIRTICSTVAAFADKHEPDLSDPKKMELHKLYRPERLTPTEKGYQLLNTPRLSK